MNVSLKITALVLSSALAGAAAPALANGYYQGLDPHAPQAKRHFEPTMSLPPVLVTPVDTVATGSIEPTREPRDESLPPYIPGEGRYYFGTLPPELETPGVDTMATGSIEPTREPRDERLPRYIPGEGRYYRGIVPPTP